MADQERPFHPQDSVGDAVRTAGLLGSVGFAASAVANALSRQNVGMLGVFTRTGTLVVMATIAGAGYGFSRGAAANLRRKNDSYNEAIGGFVCGAVVGLTMGRTLPALIGYGSVYGTVVSAYHYTGGKLSGYSQDPNVDEFDRKMALRANKRRPIQETIDELGEGRGIYAPGYAERRRQRIKDAYGIDVTERGTSVAAQSS